jgi:hypothetical protein
MAVGEQAALTDVVAAWGGDGGAFVNAWRVVVQGDRSWATIGEDASRRIDEHAAWMHSQFDASPSVCAGRHALLSLVGAWRNILLASHVICMVSRSLKYLCCARGRQTAI